MTIKLVVPDTNAGLEEALNDPATLKAVTEDPKTLAQYIADYTAATLRRDAGLDEQIQVLVQKGLADFYREHDQDVPKNRLNLTPSKPGLDKGVGYNPDAPGARLDGMFKNIAELASITTGKSRLDGSAVKFAELQGIQNSFGSLVPSDGGFLVPEILRSQIMGLMLELSMVRPRATVIPMDSLRVPIPIIDETTHVGSVFGGITSYWTEEAGGLTDSVAKFGRILLEARKLTSMAIVPNELIRDAITSLEAFISQRFPLAMAFQEDVAFFSGSGVDQPAGFLNSVTNPAIVSVPKETNQKAATVVWQNVVKMYSRMYPTSLNNAAWFVAPDVLPELFTMALQVGVAGSAIYMQNGTLTPTMTLLGRPVIVTEKSSVVGTVGDISFVDLAYYLIGDRQALEVATSEHVDFKNDKTAIRFIQRVDGKPWIKSAVTPANGSTNTLSPFVNLATRA